jgi:hypothetical protein
MMVFICLDADEMVIPSRAGGFQRETVKGSTPLQAFCCVVAIACFSQALASQHAARYLAFQHKPTKSFLTPEQAELVAELKNGTKDASYLCQCKEILWGPGPETGVYKGSPVVEEHYALEKKLRLAENLGQVGLDPGFVLFPARTQARPGLRVQ